MQRTTPPLWAAPQDRRELTVTTGDVVPCQRPSPLLAQNVEAGCGHVFGRSEPSQYAKTRQAVSQRRSRNPLHGVPPLGVDGAAAQGNKARRVKPKRARRISAIADGWTTPKLLAQ